MRVWTIQVGLLSGFLSACLPAFHRGAGTDGVGAGDGVNSNGTITLPGGGSDGTGSTTIALDAAVSSLHRLTPNQYMFTVRDLLGLADADVASVQVPMDPTEVPSLLTVTDLDAAATLLASLGAHRKFAPCDVTGKGSTDCATQFISAFASKAFRHPITSDEQTWLNGVFSSASATSGLAFSDAIDVVARLVLEAPQTFYVLEAGQAVDGLPDGLLRVSQFELASRLSYFLWDSMPDDALFAAAAANGLSTSDGIKVQLDRMFADPRARAKVLRWVSQWLELDGTAKHVSVEAAVKSTTQFPLDNTLMRTAMRTEIEEFAGHVWDAGGSVSDLFNSTDAYVNGPLATLYGVNDGPSDANTWKWVSLDPTQRAGIATRAAFLMIYSYPDTPSPIRRGSAVWREFLGYTFPPPPPNAACVQIAGGTKDSSGNPMSIRDSVKENTLGDTQCAGCHSKLDPAGFPFGHYDAFGQWWTQESGTASDGTRYTAAIDATGDLVGSDVDVPVDGAVALSAQLAASRDVKNALTASWWAQAFGRAATTAEQPSLAYAQDQLAASGKLQDGIVAIIASPAFQYLRKGAP